MRTWKLGTAANSQWRCGLVRRSINTTHSSLFNVIYLTPPEQRDPSFLGPRNCLLEIAIQCLGLSYCGLLAGSMSSSIIIPGEAVEAVALLLLRRDVAMGASILRRWMRKP